MSSLSLSLGEHLPSVKITEVHIERALRAMEGTYGCPMGASGEYAAPEFALHAAAVLAVVEGFRSRFEEAGLAQYCLVEEAVGRDYMRDHACEGYDLIENPDKPRNEPTLGGAVAQRLATVEQHLMSAGVLCAVKAC